jgi:hypothetical protein
VTNPALLGTGIPYGRSRRGLLVGGTPSADRTISGRGMGVRIGVGVGPGETGGAAGGISCGAAGSLPCFFFTVASFAGVRRGGGGELRGCAIELPSLLKKSPIGLPAVAGCPLARNASTDKIKTTLRGRQTISAVTLHYAALCSISRRLLVGRDSVEPQRIQTHPGFGSTESRPTDWRAAASGRRGAPSPSSKVDLAFVRPHAFRLALLSSLEHSQQRRVS